MRKDLGPQFFRGDQPLPFREAVQVGDTVYLSGQLAFDDQGAICGADIQSQTARCLANIESVLSRCGLGVQDIFKVTAWLVDSADFPAFNATFADVFGDNLPVRSTVRADLVAPGALVELEVMAYHRPE